MARRRKTYGFSWKRATGVTAAKQKFARATGIPTTRAGRKAKMQRMLWTAVATGVAAGVSSALEKNRASSHERQEVLTAPVSTASTAGFSPRVARIMIESLVLVLLIAYLARNSPSPTPPLSEIGRASLAMPIQHLSLAQIQCENAKRALTNDKIFPIHSGDFSKFWANEKFYFVKTQSWADSLTSIGVDCGIPKAEIRKAQNDKLIMSWDKTSKFKLAKGEKFHK